MQLRFTSLTVASSRRDLHPQECAHAGRTKKKPADLAARAKSNLFTELEETGKLYRNAAYTTNLLLLYKLFTKRIIKCKAGIYCRNNEASITVVSLSVCITIFERISSTPRAL